MSFDISNKITLVTGANRGIGKAIVESFLQHGASKVYAGVRSLDKAEMLVAEFGEKVVPIVIDYERPASIKAAAESAGDAQVVVSNAGILIGADVMATDIIENFENRQKSYEILHFYPLWGAYCISNKHGNKKHRLELNWPMAISTTACA